VDPHFREGRLYVRDDRPFAGPDPPAAVFSYSRNRGGEHPNRHLAGYAGILQADAYAGFGDLYDARRRPGPITEAACWSHGRRKFFVLADLGKSPLAIEAVRRIDEIFAIEREINGLAAEQRLAVRRKRVTPLVDDLKAWMLTERARLSRHADIAKAMDYMLKRWPAFTRFLDDGRICLSNNAAERALRGVALGRRAWLFTRSDRGGERAAAMYTLIATAKLNGIDPPGLARRRAASHCRSCDFPARRTAALAVEATRNPGRCRLSPHHGLGRMVTALLRDSICKERAGDLTRQVIRNAPVATVVGVRPGTGRMSGPGQKSTRFRGHDRAYQDRSGALSRAERIRFAGVGTWAWGSPRG